MISANQRTQGNKGRDGISLVYILIFNFLISCTFLLIYRLDSFLALFGIREKSFSACKRLGVLKRRFGKSTKDYVNIIVSVITIQSRWFSLPFLVDHKVGK